MKKSQEKSEKKRMRVYIAGPMRGREGWNLSAFDAAESLLRDAGHHPFSPAALVRAMGYPIGGACEPEEQREHLKHVMLSDIACIYAADAIAVLPGWEKSVGASVEVALAQYLGLPIYNAVTMERIEGIPKTPWNHIATNFPKLSNWTAQKNIQLTGPLSGTMKEQENASQIPQHQSSISGAGIGHPLEYDPDNSAQ